MSYSKAQAALKHYSQVNAHSGVVYANSHQLVQMLLSAAIDRIAASKGHMLRSDIAEKAGNISRAMDIIDGLRLGLDPEQGGDIARNLTDLYDYMTRKLLEANTFNKPDLLDEVATLLMEIRRGWEAIPVEAIQSHAQRVQTIQTPVVG